MTDFMPKKIVLGPKDVFWNTLADSAFDMAMFWRAKRRWPEARAALASCRECRRLARA